MPAASRRYGRMEIGATRSLSCTCLAHCGFIFYGWIWLDLIGFAQAGLRYRNPGLLGLDLISAFLGWQRLHQQIFYGWIWLDLVRLSSVLQGPVLGGL